MALYALTPQLYNVPFVRWVMAEEYLTPPAPSLWLSRGFSADTHVML